MANLQIANGKWSLVRSQQGGGQRPFGRETGTSELLLRVRLTPCSAGFRGLIQRMLWLKAAEEVHPKENRAGFAEAQPARSNVVCVPSYTTVARSGSTRIS